MIRVTNLFMKNKSLKFQDKSIYGSKGAGGMKSVTDGRMEG